jgi:hypothetical protein
VDLTNPLRIWIPATKFDQPLVEKLEFHQALKDPFQHQRNKHIELQMHFIRKLIHDLVIEVLFFPTEY